MPNYQRAKERGKLEMPMDIWGRVHRHFFDGLYPALRGMDETRKREMLTVLDQMEKILMQSGFMSAEDIALRHKEKEESGERRLIVTPYEVMRGNA